MRGSGQAGYSLVELVILLTVIAVVLAVTIPSIKQTLTTYHRNGAAREVLAQIREAQSAAVTRGGVYAFQWGGDTGVNYPQSQYRVVRDTSGACALPAVGSAEDNTNVLTGWTDLSDTYRGTHIQSVVDNGGNPMGKVMFRSTGASANTCTSVSFPVTVTVADDRGRTREIEIKSAGSVRLK